MKPFDLEKALAGEPVVTLERYPVTQIALFETEFRKVLVGVVKGKLWTWCIDGTEMNSNGRLKLMMQTKKVWVNLYLKSNCSPEVVEGNIHATKDAADTYAGVGRIACVEIDTP